MGSKLKNWLQALSLAQQFLLVNMIVLVLGLLVIGWWTGEQIKIGVTDYTAATTALYVDSFVAPEVQELAEANSLSPARMANLARLLRDTPLGQKIVAFKIWNNEGRIVYSTNPDHIDQIFPLQGGLTQAWAGQVDTEISDLQAAENFLERAYASQLLETYSPVRQAGSNRVIAVAEFYQPVDELQTEIAAGQRRSWLLVGLAMLVMYLLLASIVKPASDLIVRQGNELREQVARLTDLLAQNDALNERVRRAANRTTALNEQFLRRISAELHDGPGQDVGLALLRLEALAASYQQQQGTNGPNGAVAADFHTIQVALEAALGEIRSISAGLRLPKIEPLSLAETIERALRDYERKTHHQVALTLGPLPAEVPLSLKITLYRILQEALANGYRHAGGKDQRVQAGVIDANQLWLEVADAGQGFDAKATPPDDHFGLIGMRERVEMLGGRFTIESLVGQGTKISAYLPLAIP
jgi:signal transduction histidine kinase